MDRTSLQTWLHMQGFNINKMPIEVRWYRPDGSDFLVTTMKPSFWHHLNLYRQKRFVLHKSFLDQKMWRALEEGGSLYEAMLGSRASIAEPSSVMAVVAKGGGTPRLVGRITKAMKDKEEWRGTASDLLEILGKGQGIPKNPTALSSAIIQDDVRVALNKQGIAVERGRAADTRYIRLERH